MSGGSHEYVMGNMISPNGSAMISGYNSTNNSGYTGIIFRTNSLGDFLSYKGTYSYPEEKYYDKYSFGVQKNFKRGKLGDASKEVLLNNESSTGWYEQSGNLIYQSATWYLRGNSYKYSDQTGIFANLPHYGNEKSDSAETFLYTTRFVITI